MNTNTNYNAYLVSNGEWCQWVRDGRTYTPKFTDSIGSFASEEDAEAAAREKWDIAETTDHIVVIGE